jgi:hypothetical protein
MNPSCEFPLSDTDTIHAFIKDALKKREPTSIIRLGDGEGMVLARPTPEDMTLWSHVKTHFGPNVSTQFIRSLADKLKDAVDSADVLGVRDDLLNVDFPKDNFSLSQSEFTQQFRTLFNLRPGERHIDYPGALRLALTHRFLSENEFRDKTLFASAWLHFKLSQSGALVELISTQESIGLVSSKPSLVRQLENLLGITVSYYQIPDIYSKTTFNLNMDAIHQLPDQLTHTFNSLKVDFPGQLFLVGGGVFGKAYCHKVKKLGGVAIDIGAVCDAWIGISSRPLVFQTLFGVTGDKVPEALLLKHQVNNI